MSVALVIEDNPDNILLITDILEASGYTVLQAMSGQEGLETALTQQPDFILLDIQLPDIDGYEVVKRLLAHDESKDIPIIAMTSYAMKGDREKLLGGGCTGYIEKPINPNKVIDQIREAIGDGQ
jgi:two-component system, cell cycle response regulator DivK